MSARVCHVWLKHFTLGSPVINIRIHLTYKIPLNYLLENRYASFLLFRFSPQGTGISEEVFCQIEMVQVKILHSLIMYMILNLRAPFPIQFFREIVASQFSRVTVAYGNTGCGVFKRGYKFRNTICLSIIILKGNY